MVTKNSAEIKVDLLNSIIEVPVEELVDGKKIRLDLTRMLRGKSIEVTFKINAKESLAEPQKLKLLQFYIRRLIRKGTSYIEDSFLCQSKDGVLRVKPFLITRKKVSRRIRKALCDKTREVVGKSFEDKTITEIFSAVLSNKLQRELSLKLKKIYPLAVCEIRRIEPEKERAK